MALHQSVGPIDKSRHQEPIGPDFLVVAWSSFLAPLFVTLPKRKHLRDPTNDRLHLNTSLLK